MRAASAHILSRLSIGTCVAVHGMVAPAASTCHRYARHLRVYASHFSWPRMLILRSEDLFADSWTVTASALQFAEIPILAEHEAHVRSKMATGKVKANDGAKWGVSGEGYRGAPPRCDSIICW